MPLRLNCVISMWHEVTPIKYNCKSFIRCYNEGVLSSKWQVWAEENTTRGFVLCKMWCTLSAEINGAIRGLSSGTRRMPRGKRLPS